MVETSQESLDGGKYRSRMHPNEVKSFLHTWCHKFQLTLVMIEKDKAADFILKTFNEFYKIEKEKKQ
jgi:hypothetical protein